MPSCLGVVECQTAKAARVPAYPKSTMPLGANKETCLYRRFWRNTAAGYSRIGKKWQGKIL
jgi:hypothetical protein